MRITSTPASARPRPPPGTPVGAALGGAVLPLPRPADWYIMILRRTSCTQGGHSACVQNEGLFRSRAGTKQRRRISYTNAILAVAFQHNRTRARSTHGLQAVGAHRSGVVCIIVEVVTQTTRDVCIVHRANPLLDFAQKLNLKLARIRTTQRTKRRITTNRAFHFVKRS
jgi:hypothetical protein